MNQEQKGKYLLDYSEMQVSEVEFIKELIARYRPKKLLEIGIAAGSCSAIMLNEIRDRADAAVFGIDYNERYYRDSSKKTGWIIDEVYPELKNRMRIYSGGLAACFLDEIGGDIDFCVIDTMHTLPGELLDFLMVLPYMSENAICVLHDTNLQNLPFKSSQNGLIRVSKDADSDDNLHYHAYSYATGVLMSVLATEKIFPREYLRDFASPNIAAIQITSDLKKYIQNIFFALLLPWRDNLPSQDIKIIGDSILRHYSMEQSEYFHTVAGLMQRRSALIAKEEKISQSVQEALQQREEALQQREEALQRRNVELEAIIFSENWKCFVSLNRGFDFFFPHASVRRKLVRMSYKFLRALYKKTRYAREKIIRIIFNTKSSWNRVKKNCRTTIVENETWPSQRPLISIVIPCFNYGKFVEEAIDSILSQTFDNFEIIVVDGGSTDKTTREILKKLKKEKTEIYLRDGSHLVGDNRNYGINLAKGKYICCLDADDKLDSTYLEKGLFYLETYRYDVVYPSVQCFGENDVVWYAFQTSFEKMVCVGNSVPTVAIFTKASWKKCHGYKDWPIGDGHVPEDWEFWSRLIGMGFRFKTLKEPLMFYRVHSGGITAKNTTLLEEQRLSVYNENKNFFDRKYQRIRKRGGRLIYQVKNPFVNLKKSQVHKYMLFLFPSCISDEDKNTLLQILISVESVYKVCIISVSSDSSTQSADLGIFKKITNEIFQLRNFLDSEDEFQEFIYYLIESRGIEAIFNYKCDFFDSISHKVKKQYQNIEIIDNLFNHASWNIGDNRLAILQNYYLGQTITQKMASADVFSISIILNLHKEGVIADRVITNLVDIIQYHENFHLWSNIEVIAVLDNPDETTLAIVNRNKDIFSTIEVVSYHDLGSARNRGVSLAKNDFILFADGDDFVSLNCLPELYRVTVDHYWSLIQNNVTLDDLHDDQHIAIFHNTLIEFPNLYAQKYRDSNQIMVCNSMFFHLYTSKILCFRGLLLKNRVRENMWPYGFEDWDLNNRLLALGVRYKVADYILYYRRYTDKVSMSRSYCKEKYIVRNSPIYNADGFCKKILSWELSHHDDLNAAQERVSHVLLETHNAFLSRYGEGLLPTKELVVGNFNRQASGLVSEVKIYKKILDFLMDRDIIFFGPWITLGGADKLTIEYIESLRNSTFNPCLITTLKSGDRINQVFIPHLDLHAVFLEWQSISAENQLHILVKAIINSNIKIIHIVQSDLAFQLVKYYSEILKEYGIRIIVSLFNPAYDEGKKAYFGYPVSYPEVMKKADIVLSDNLYWYAFFKKLVGQEFNFRKLFTPVDEYPRFKKTYSERRKVLWASRICDQKIIDVLYEICVRKKDIEFVLYGNLSGEDYSEKFFQKLLKLKNVEYRGIYQDTSELDMDEFDLLLFTSKFEGLGIVRLDMVNHNMPVISSDAGASSEIFGENYELLVKNVYDVSEYCEKIDAFYANPKFYFDKTSVMRKDISSRYSAKRFRGDYLDVIKSLRNE